MRSAEDNHQRHLPPHERDQQAYRVEIINNAAQTGLGLMTTWDLWRIARSAKRLHWPKEAVKDIFYRTGRIDPVPSHYRQLGTIVKIWPEKHALGIMPLEKVEVGARLAVEVGDTFEESNVSSLQVDGKDVQYAHVGSNCGVHFGDAVKKFRESARVFIVSGS